jgi:hypothetical protein
VTRRGDYTNDAREGRQRASRVVAKPFCFCESKGLTKAEQVTKKMIAVAASLAVLLAASVAVAQMRPLTPAQP